VPGLQMTTCTLYSRPLRSLRIVRLPSARRGRVHWPGVTIRRRRRCSLLPDHVGHLLFVYTINCSHAGRALTQTVSILKNGDRNPTITVEHFSLVDSDMHQILVYNVYIFVQTIQEGFLHHTSYK